jgi:transketolase
MASVKELKVIADILRRDCLEMTSAAGSGHPTSCMSVDEMRYNVRKSDDSDNDEFILSKGHAAPILYSALFRAGAIKHDLKTLRKLNSSLEGHPMPRSFPWVKVATGSLGQGLSIGIGMSLAAKLSGKKFRTYVLMGDSEAAEGSVYEALQMAPIYRLDNLVMILDANRLGQRGATMLGHDVSFYEKRFKYFGWNTNVINGHNVRQLKRALKSVRRNGKPTAIIAKTFKGKGVSFLENKEGWHGKTLNVLELEQALKQIPSKAMPHGVVKKPEKTLVWKYMRGTFKESPYEIGGLVATRDAYGKVLANLAKSDGRVLAVDAEVSNSTRSAEVKKATPKQFIETYIAEQNMVGICLGLSKKGFNVFGSTFAAFLSRAHDQIRMSALSSGNFTLCGSHAGVSIGEDGPSQMGLEDIAMFRDIPGSIVFYPSDAVSCEKIMKLCSGLKGMKYIRTTRGKTPVLYERKENFVIGGYKVLKKSKSDKVVLVGAGITVGECLKSADKMKCVAVVDLYGVKPFKGKQFVNFVKKHGQKVVIAEDHYPEGGIGEMLAEIFENERFKVEHLAIPVIPHSGKPGELMKKYGIDSAGILRAAKKLIKE